MGGGSPGVSLPDLGGIWFAVSASFPCRWLTMMAGASSGVRCLPSGVVSLSGWCAYRLGDLPPSVSLCVDPGGCDGMEVSTMGGCAASFPGRLIVHDGRVILWA